jgi:hypothetical protein
MGLGQRNRQGWAIDFYYARFTTEARRTRRIKRIRTMGYDDSDLVRANAIIEREPRSVVAIDFVVFLSAFCDPP